MKYLNVRKEVDGIVFDSKLESQFYEELKARDDIILIAIQPKFTIREKFEYLGKKYRAITYKPDFLVQYSNGSFELYDVKGYESDLWKYKEKHIKYFFMKNGWTFYKIKKKNGKWSKE